MDFLSTGEVAGYLQIADTSNLTGACELAEALVAAQIGCDTLLRAESAVTLVTTLVRNRPSIELPYNYGPILSISQITSLQVYGDEAMDLDDLEVRHPWVLKRSTDFPYDTEITIVLSPGFTISDLPEQIRKAMVVTAAERYKRPDTSIQSERIGDYQYTLDAAQQLPPIPELASLLIRHWRRPEL